MKVMENM